MRSIRQYFICFCLLPVVVHAADIVPPGGKLDEVWNDGEFTEGVAAGPDGAIYFSDIPRSEAEGKVFRFDPGTGNTTVFCADSGKSNGLMFNTDGQLIAACGANAGRRALCRINAEGAVVSLVDSYRDRKLNSPNDLCIHPNGTIYFSDPRYSGNEPLELDLMNVYRFDPATEELSRLNTDITKPNGLMLSPDAKTLYIAETNNGRVGPDAPQTDVKMTLNAFPVLADGTIGQRRVMVDFGEQLGVDGMTVDTDGRIYAAVRSPKRFGIRIYTPLGDELAAIPTPSLPTNCTFGRGPEKQTLYVTAGGGLYRIRLNATGHHSVQFNQQGGR